MFSSAIISIGGQTPAERWICSSNGANEHESVFLKGNHESFLFDVLRDPTYLHQWRRVWRPTDSDFLRIAAVAQSRSSRANRAHTAARGGHSRAPTKVL